MALSDMLGSLQTGALAANPLTRVATPISPGVPQTPVLTDLPSITRSLDRKYADPQI